MKQTKRGAVHEKSGDVRVGISGWTYAPWRGAFFPKGLKQREELAYAASVFRTIEINGTFYGLQRPDAFARWATEVPEDFVFSIKAPRFITHIRRARDVEMPIANFLASGPLRLGEKLGPILWQFPPSFHFDAELMERFLALLPHDTEAASALARRHETRLDGRDWTETDAVRPLRHAVEVRHQSFETKAFVDAMAAANVAIVCADTVEWPRMMEVTADFCYCRLHGSEQIYADGYGAPAIGDWCDRVTAWREGGAPSDAKPLGAKPSGDKSGGQKRQPRDVFVYFDNDLKVRAPHDAKALMESLADRGRAA